MPTVAEARLRDTGKGLVPDGPGWFVLNAKEAAWGETPDFGRGTRFEGPGEASFGQFGINIRVLQPGHPLCRYHAENAQEGFLILDGSGTLIVEGEERPLRRWDFVHSPAWTKHVIVASGEEPLVVLSVGARPEREELLYPRDETALRHRAGVEQETTSGDEAYAGTSDYVGIRYVDGDLPG
jgi:uncharacterized cupin superfamily protein